MNHLENAARIAMLTVALSMVSLATRAVAGSPSSVVNQGPVTLHVRANKAVAQVADPIALVLEVTAPAGTRVQLPQLKAKLGDFEVHSTEVLRDIPAAEKGDMRLWVMKATLESLATGVIEVPPVDVQYSTAKAPESYETIRSQPLKIEIASVLENRADPTKFRDIKSVVDVEVPAEHSRSWIVWAVAGAGTAAVLAIAAVLLSRRSRGPAPAAWALMQIDDLEQLLTEDSRDPELIFNELVDVVREFFEFEYDVPTLTQTSHEFLAEAAQTVGLPEGPRQRLSALIVVADEVKFARYGVSRGQLEQAFADAKAFVRDCELHHAATIGGEA